ATIDDFWLPSFQVRLSRIGTKTMTLVASDDTEINCHR
ncbi:MAG: hypothetical protein ACI9D8_001202, partial [Reinekea sp.]